MEMYKKCRLDAIVFVKMFVEFSLESLFEKRCLLKIKKFCLHDDIICTLRLGRVQLL